MTGAASSPLAFPPVFPPAPLQRDHLAELVFERALLRGSFTLRSGAVSDRYFDKYLATTDPRLLGPLGSALAATIAEAVPDAQLIVAPELGAVPIATAVSLALGLPFAIVRGTAKQHGTGRRIEGELRPGVLAVLVEDVVTSGGAALTALAAARDAGAVIEAAACVLDRSTPASDGREALLDAGVVLHSLLDGDDLDAALAAGTCREAHGSA